MLELGPRAQQAPWLSEDLALVGILADVCGYQVVTVRLREREALQGQRAQALELLASRSRLQALRAQVNPHFLFNALNAIAGLIHRDPDLPTAPSNSSPRCSATRCASRRTSGRRSARS